MFEDKGIKEQYLVYDNVLNFLTAGNCDCVITNSETGNYFVYKLKSMDNANKFFLNIKTGTKDKDYTYAGFIVYEEKDKLFKFVRGNKGKYESTSTSVKVIIYTLNKLLSKTLPNVIQVYNIGRCARCGRQLTDIDSIRRGLGPECYKKNQ